MTSHRVQPHEILTFCICYFSKSFKTDLINYEYDRWQTIFARRCDINDETYSETVHKNIHVMHYCTWHGKWVLSQCPKSSLGCGWRRWPQNMEENCE